jgi:protocatechuate 3,4-dioxygenase beta subunit
MGLKSSLSRREALGLLSGATLALATSGLSSAQTASSRAANPVPFGADSSSYSLLTPELTEGPYYIDSERIRRDITEGKPGVPLRLRIKVVHVSTGAPVSGAAVDIWHCDAQGVYSGFADQGPPPFGNGHPRPFPPGPPPMSDEDGMLPPQFGGGFPPAGFRGPRFGPGHSRDPDNRLTFLRGVQLTETTGMAEIDTVVPGWYAGRATHIHVRVHNGGVVADGRYRKGHISHTGQIFLPADFTDQIYRLPAYARKSQDRLPLEEDGIFRQSGMRLARIVAVDPGKPRLGFFSDTLLVIDPTATPNPA